tara:strand:+ start:1131 stop:1451 length:321 start_codon:yes stop_codon:yes gene_type:complete
MSIYGTLKAQSTLVTQKPSSFVQDTRKTTLNIELMAGGDIHLTSKDEKHVGWVHYDVVTRRFKPVMAGCGCADGTSFLSMDAAKFMALAHYAERAAQRNLGHLQDD